jgi:ribosome-associated protein
MQPAIRTYYHLEEIWGDKPVRMKMDDGAKAGLVKASPPQPSSRRSTDKVGAREPARAKAPAPRAAASSQATARKTAARKAATPKAGSHKRASAPAKKAAARTPVSRTTGTKSPARNAPAKKAGATGRR